MSKGTSIKDALAKWSKENEQPAPEAEEIKLICQLPPIDKMDTRFLVKIFMTRKRNIKQSNYWRTSCYLRSSPF